MLQFTPELFAQPSLPELARLAPLAQKSGVGLRVTGAVHRTVVEQLVGMRTAGGIGRLASLLRILEVLHDARKLAHDPGASLDAIPGRRACGRWA